MVDVAPTVRSQSVLTSIARYDELRNTASNITHVGNIDHIVDEKGNGSGICSLAFMMPFSFFPGPARVPFPFMGVLEDSLAVALAAKHLNTGHGSVVPEVEGLKDRCNVRFTTEYFDSEMSEKRAVDQTIDILNRVPGEERLPWLLSVCHVLFVRLCIV